MGTVEKWFIVYNFVRQAALHINKSKKKQRRTQKKIGMKKIREIEITYG